MAADPRTHRASAQRRRAALLDAAAELAAEIGAGAVTHRAVAARAGVPLSTTSYFFGSIDELVTEALRRSSQERVAAFDDAEAAWVLNEGQPTDVMVERVVDSLLAHAPQAEAGQVETYLAAGREPSLQADVSATVNRFASRSAWQLERMGSARAEALGWALQALADGALLHRVAGVETDHRAHLTEGIRMLLAASMLDDQEVERLLGRFHRGGHEDADPSGEDAGAPASSGA